MGRPLLVALALLAACDARSAPPSNERTRLAPIPSPSPSPQRDTPEDLGVDAPADAAPSPWLTAPVRAGCCTDTHGLGPATLRDEDGGLVLRLTEDVPMHCDVELGPDGEPLNLRDCRMMPPWVVLTPKIPLRCSYASGHERCTGRYRIDNTRYPDRGGDSVTLERAAAPPAPPPPPSEAEIAARRVAWSRASVHLLHNPESSWRGQIHEDHGRLVLTLDPLSNLTHCDVELGDDGDPTALVGCVPVRADWAPVRRRNPLRCTRSENRPGEVRCRGSFPWRDAYLTYDNETVTLVSRDEADAR